MALLANTDNPFKPPYEPIDWICLACTGILVLTVTLKVAKLIWEQE
jgi:hypothetical protein